MPNLRLPLRPAADDFSDRRAFGLGLFPRASARFAGALLLSTLTACGGGGADATSATTAGATIASGTTATSTTGSSAATTSTTNAATSAADNSAAATAAASAPAATSSGTATVTAWLRFASDGDAITVTTPQTVRYGDGVHWVTMNVSSAGTCSAAFFGSDPAPWVYKSCETQVTVPAVVQTGTMPVVNTALIPGAATSFATARVRALTTAELASSTFQPAPTDVGAFREPCSYSHMAFDDPIAYPGKPGVSHLHTFMGNDSTSAASTSDSLSGSGGSTCDGGTLNRTGYWMPTMIDTRTGQPIVASGSLLYYKLGYLGVQAGTVQPFPKGLRMIAGSSAGTPTNPSANARFACLAGGTWQASIPSCAVGDTMRSEVTFPQCWDGVNVDSPDHKSHMAYATGSGCPADHPVALPEITINFDYIVPEANLGSYWKLSSDNYAGTGGYSLHADWFGGWDTATNTTFVDDCLNASMDCHAMLLGDGRILY